MIKKHKPCLKPQRGGKARCNVCGEVVSSSEMRAHLESHAPAAHALDFDDVRSQFCQIKR